MAGKRKASPPGEDGPETKKIKITSNTTTASKTGSFLDLLSAELRNKIYEMALLSPTPIAVSHNWTPPGLLSTNSQARNEAKALFWTQNTFRIAIANCDATLNNNFLALMWGMGLSTTLIMRYTGRANWKNTLLWCKAVHAGKSKAAMRMLGIIRTPVGETYRTVVAATEAAGEMRKVPWEVVERVLMSIKYAGEGLKGEWEDGMSD